MPHTKGCRVLNFLGTKKLDDYIDVHEYTRHVFGVKSTPTCADYALLQTGMENKDSHLIAANANKRNFSVDNFAKSMATVEEVVQVYKDMRTTLQLGRCNLLKWICSNKMISWIFSEEYRSGANHKTLEIEPHFSSLMVMQWNDQKGTLEACCGAEKEVPNKISGWTVFSFGDSAFEPLEFFAPYMFLMTIWSKKWTTVGWQKWRRRWGKVPGLGSIVDSWRKSSENTIFWQKLRKNWIAIFLRCFFGVNVCSGSPARLEEDAGVELSFVSRKCRMVPMRQPTITKLELQAALYSVRLRQLMNVDHDSRISAVTQCTDLITVL